MIKKILILLISPLLLSSCSFGDSSEDYEFLNYKYTLNEAGDIHGAIPTSGEVGLYKIAGFTNYINHFDRENSYINFQVVGDSFETTSCNGTFCLKDKKGNYVVGNDVISFNCRHSGGQSGKIIFSDSYVANLLGNIYVFTPYWCRCQFEYDINNDGNPLLLTFEFWKSSYNEVPEWK